MKALENLSSEGYKIPQESLQPSEPEVQARQFNRIDLSTQQVQLQFQSGQHFAKSYIDNISLGGLFVRSEEKRSLGEVIDVSFSLPADRGQAPLFLAIRAKVARVTTEGWGLEFVGLDSETRHKIESYVRGILPTGIDLRSTLRASAIERLREMRDDKETQDALRRRKTLQYVILGSLFVLNISLLAIQSGGDLREKTVDHRDRSFVFGNQKLKLHNVRAVQSTKGGTVLIQLSDGSRVEEKRTEALPVELRKDLEQLNALKTQKVIRKPINPSLVVTGKFKKDGARRRR